MKISKSPKAITATLVLILLISGFLLYFYSTASAAYIIINGEKIGLASSKSNGEKIVQKVLEDYGKSIGQVALTKEKIEYAKVRVPRKTLLSEGVNEEELRQKLNPYVEGYTIEVSGEVVAILPHEEDINTVLEQYKDSFKPADESKKITSTEISEEITSNKIETQPEKIQQPNDVVDMFKKGKQNVKEYVVQPNDSWWLIARKNNMLTKEVLESNPDLTEDSPLQPNQKIKLVTTTPYLTVVSKGEYTSTEIIPFDVITETDYNLASNQTKVKKEGSDGSKLVTYSFIEKNGNIVEKNVISEKITKEPVNQIISKGPKRIVAATSRTSSNTLSRGSASNPGFIWPLRGPITSYYGWRSRGFHLGIDIDGYTGDPIVAAASGKVVEARYAGNYGLMVLIDHGNGISTRYSHASKLLVSPGQTVSKGQTIALVGSTGNSTGSHLDFEVIINGNNVNPLNYLP